MEQTAYADADHADCPGTRRSTIWQCSVPLVISSSEGSGTTPEVPDSQRNNSAVVAEKQAGYVQTNLTLSSAELEIQSMVDVPIHQEDLVVQRTPLIDPVISMVTEKTTSTPTPPTTQAHVQICETLSRRFFGSLPDHRHNPTLKDLQHSFRNSDACYHVPERCEHAGTKYLLETQNAAVQDTNSSAQQDAMILSVFEQLSHQVTNCNKVNKDNLIANETLSAELERYKERVKLLEERQNVDLGTREKLIIDDIIRDKDAQFADFEKEINSLKQTLSEQLKEKESLTKTFNVFKNESKEKEAKNIDNEIALEKKVKELDNIKAQQISLMLYDGSVIAKETNVISIADSEETLMVEEES
ncbi:hypothetical protein Tco_1523137 [Tanacetum coccineum]